MKMELVETGQGETYGIPIETSLLKETILQDFSHTFDDFQK